MRNKPQREEWPPFQPTSIINVTVIHYKNRLAQQQLIKISEHLKTGATGFSKLESSLSHSTVTKDISEIFKVDPADQAEGNTKSKPPKLILIEGAPGIGKTVLAKEIAYLWADNKLLTDCKMLILIYLRNPEVHTMKSVEELLKLYSADGEVAREVNAYLKKSNGENMAFVFDGFDEFPIPSQRHSVIADILGTSSDYIRKFSESTVVVTSRPTATLFLHEVVDRRIEILGLDPEERHKIISLFPGKTTELEKYFIHHPIISSVCYIPLNLAILLYLFRQGSLPKTLTEMNESFIFHTVYRHIKKSSSPLTGWIKCLKYLPENVVKILHKIATLAFNGLQRNKLVFTYDELMGVCPEILDIPEATNGFSLLQAVEHYPQNGAGITTTYNFLHLTMQEYLAAFYVSTLPEKQQLELLQKTFWEGHFNFMWMMYVGAVGVKSASFASFIGMNTIHKISLPCTGRNKMNVSGQFDSIKNTRYLHLFQCYMEAKTDTEMPKEISTIFNNGSITFADITLLSHHVTSLLIFMFTYSTQQWKSFILSNCNLQKIEITNILHTIINNKEQISTLQCVDLSENTASPWGVYCAIIRHCCINSLTLCGDEGMKEYIQEITDSLQANTTITSLTLHSVGKIGVEAIKQVLCNKLTLRRLKLSWQVRKVYYNNVEKTLIHTVFSPNTVEIQSYDQANTNDANQTVNANAVYNIDICYKVIPTIGIRNDEPGSIHLPNEKVNDSAVHVLVFGLQNDTTVKQLNISNNEITDEGAVAIIDCLKHNKTLKELDISSNGISINGMNKMVKKLNAKCQGHYH